ncbi:uncharacterized protein LOC100906137 [Galendromus occidentalis]|uniref:Uncharacterized protein LOC100906137 n=1 Tax=Galendromus occidentalis TaxID=34638 RepID=A0AAJ6QYA4_9ACAR|nr:uncharacterized protein LOC100906137 [Galendromus occidentalis]
MVSYVASILIVTIVICVSQGHAQRCSLQECAALLTSMSRRSFKNGQMDALICSENSNPGDNFVEPIFPSQGSSRTSHKISKVTRNTRGDGFLEWMKDWDRSSSASNRRDDELFDGTGNDSFAEENQYEETAPMFSSDRTDTYSLSRPQESSPDATLYPDRSGRRSESLRARSFALSATPGQARQVVRIKQ